MSDGDNNKKEKVSDQQIGYLILSIFIFVSSFVSFDCFFLNIFFYLFALICTLCYLGIFFRINVSMRIRNQLFLFLLFLLFFLLCFVKGYDYSNVTAFLSLTVGVGVNALLDAVMNYKVVSVREEDEGKKIKKDFFQWKIIFNALYLSFGLALYFHAGNFYSAILILFIGTLITFFTTFEIVHLKLKKLSIFIIVLFFLALLFCTMRLA